MLAGQAGRCLGGHSSCPVAHPFTTMPTTHTTHISYLNPLTCIQHHSTVLFLDPIYAICLLFSTKILCKSVSLQSQLVLSANIK